MKDDNAVDIYAIPELTKKESEELNKLRGKFNVIKEHESHIVVASRRVEISRVWAKRMLSASFFLNCLTILCFIISMWFVGAKPQPKYFGTTPNGKIYELKSVQNIKQLL